MTTPYYYEIFFAQLNTLKLVRKMNENGNNENGI